MASLPVKMYIGHTACDTRQLQYRRITLSSWGRIYGRDTYVPKDRITCCLHAHCGGGGGKLPFHQDLVPEDIKAHLANEVERVVRCHS